MIALKSPPAKTLFVILGNQLFPFARLKPYRWFMEMLVDSNEWVMVPNVYGMGIFSDDFIERVTT